MICSDFPVIYSTLAPSGLVKWVLPEYGLAEVERCDLWHRGMSDIYLVHTAKRQFVLRVSHHHWRSQSDIQFELEFLRFLEEKQLPVSAPLVTLSGELAVEIQAPEGKRYAALFPYAPGKVPVGDFNVRQSWALGAVVANIHTASQEFGCDHVRKSLDLEHLLDDSLGIILPFLGDRPLDWGFMQDVSKELKQALEQLPQEEPFWAVCWGDPHSGNVHFTSDNTFTLFDFDQCGYGWRAFEIGKFFQVALTVGIRREVREAFLAGYQSQIRISQQELAALQPLTQVAHIWMWAINLQTMCLYDCSRLDSFYFTNRLQHLKTLRSHDWQLF